MLIFSLIVFFIAFLLFFDFISKKQSLISFDLVYIYSIIIVSFVPIIYINFFEGYLRIDNNGHYGINSYISYIVFNIISISLVYVSFLFSKQHNLASYDYLKDLSLISNRSENLIILISVILSIPFIYLILTLITNNGLSGYLANRIILLKGNGYIVSLIKFPQIAIGIVFFNQLLGRYFYSLKMNRVKIVFLLIYAIFLALIVGSRTQVMIPIISMIVIYLIVRYQGFLYLRNFKKAFLFSFGLLILATSAGGLRESVMSGTDLSFNNQTKEPPLNGIMFTYGSMENLLWLFENEKPNEYLYGKTFLAALVGFVPRSLWPEKPTGAGPEMKNLISGGAYDLDGGENITSTTTGLLVESYLNFSWFGVLIPSVVYFVMKYLLCFLSRLTTSVFISLYSYLIFKFFGLASAEFFGIFSHVFVFIIAAFFFDFIIRVFNGKVILYR